MDCAKSVIIFVKKISNIRKNPSICPSFVHISFNEDNIFDFILLFLNDPKSFIWHKHIHFSSLRAKILQCAGKDI